MSDVSNPSDPSDEGTPRVGLVLDGRWRLRRPLASGGMGTVWVGEHVTLGEPVAIKLMRIDGDARGAAERTSRFQLEARLAAELGRRSRHVVRVFDHGIVGDLAYLVSELVDGETLESTIAREGRLPAGRVATVIHQIAKALTVVHAAGVVHRDLKPANVAVTFDEDDQVLARLIDFGIAKVSRPLDGARHRTGRGVVLGTPALMSPEQAMGLSIDGRTDVWALACIAYEALTGRPVVDGDAPEEILCRICSFDLAPLRGDAPLPGPLHDLFVRAFARDLDARFADAASFARAFELACASTRAQTQSPGRDQRRRLRVTGETETPLTQAFADGCCDTSAEPIDLAPLGRRLTALAPNMDASGPRARLDVLAVSPVDPAVPLARRRVGGAGPTR